MSHKEEGQENGLEVRKGDFECRMLIPSKMAGSIIGKKGANIQMLRSEYSANIKLPDSPGPERIFSVSAHDAETVADVIEKALPLMFGTEENEKENEIRLLIQTGAVGAIIGKGGHQIKQIRELSGANVKAYQNCAPQSSDRVVSIKGDRETLVPALRLCFQVIVDNGQRGSGMPYDPANFDSYFAHEYGGFGGQSGRFGMDGGRGRGGGVRGPPGGGGSGGGGNGNGRVPAPPGGFGRPYGNQEGFIQPIGFPSRPMGRGFGQDGFGRDVGFGPGAASAGRAKFGGEPGRFLGPAPSAGVEPVDEGRRETTQVTIPKDVAGAIIGPGGQRIRKIRNESKANITIEDVQAGSTERLITIEGTEGQISVARYLLRQAVNEQRPNPGFGNHGY